MSTIDDQAATWMVLRSERTLDDQQQQAFDAWYAQDIRHQGAYLRALAVNNALNQAMVQRDLRPVPLAADAGRAGRNGRWRALATWGGIAAGVLLLAGILMRPEPGAMLDLATAKGETRQFQLADRSVASLNSASALEVRITGSARQIRLKQGEAWFQVAKDKHKPFVVEAGEVRVRAVGTAFSVRRYRQGSDVLVTEGVVEVWSNQGGGQRVLLARGEQVFVPEQGSGIKAAPVSGDVERKLAWRSGKIVFTDQTLAEAVADFNRYSARKIVIADPAIMRLKFIGQYAIDTPELFAKDVSTYLDVPLTITADTIMIGEAHPAARRPRGKDKS